MFASAQKLKKLIAFLDLNGKQLDCEVEETMGADPAYAEKFAAFGWNVIEVADGNDVEAIWAAIDKAKISLTEMPTIIVLHTVKGKGWSKAECQESCHSMSVTVEQARQAALEFAQQKR